MPRHEHAGKFWKLTGTSTIRRLGSSGRATANIARRFAVYTFTRVGGE